MPTNTRIESNGDVLLANPIPEAEYMYGCAPTAMAMVLGYYDLYGYNGIDLSNMIEGDVDLKSRGTDGNPYNMNAFDTALGRATASEDYVYRFYARDGKATTPEQEYEYTFKEDGKTLNTDVWNCIADFLRTGQYWRGIGNLGTFVNDLQPGLDMYLQYRGYKMDYEITRVAGINSFSFADYMNEIDSGRPVLVLIAGHAMTGYGYNPDTQEIIFDDCYESGRMEWGGTYAYAGAYRPLQSIMTIGIDVSDIIDISIIGMGENGDKIILSRTKNALSGDEYCFEDDPMYLTLSITNQGIRDSGDFHMSIRIDGELLQSVSVDSIASKTTTTVTDHTLELLASGMHKVRVILNESEEIPDQNNANNKAETDILVLKSGTSVVSNEITLLKGETVSRTYLRENARLNLNGGQAFDTVLMGKVSEDRTDSTEWLATTLANVFQNGFMSDTSVYRYGLVSVYNGGTVENTHVFSKGVLSIQNGGSAINTTVESAALLFISSGGKHTGQLQIEEGAHVVVNEGGILDFDLSDLSPDASVRVNDLSRINGVPLFTITVSNTQTSGDYRLADGASSFSGVVSVNNTSGEKLGELSTGNILRIDDKAYILCTDEYSLTLTVSNLGLGNDTTPPTVSDIQADITAHTNKNVTVTATFADDKELAFPLYKIGEEGQWTLYQDGVSLYENAIVFFKAIDKAGNESEIASYTVSNIDSRIISSGLVLSDKEKASILSGTAFVNTFVSSGGKFFVSSGGVAFGATVSSGGSMRVSSGGTAFDIVENGGFVEFSNKADVSFAPNSFSGLLLASASATVHSGTTANSTTVHSRGGMFVSSGGITNDTTVISGGSMQINPGGTANSVTVNFGGKLTVSSGGSASGIVETGGYVEALKNANVSFVSNTIEELLLAGASATVHSGTTVNSASIDYRGKLDICSGGIANCPQVNSGGSMYVSAGGSANDTTVNYAGKFIVSSGGSASGIIENGGFVDFSTGADVTFLSNTISGLLLTGASATVHSGTTATNTVVSSGGGMLLSSGGIISDTTIYSSGSVKVFNSGTASSVTVNTGGKLIVSSGGSVSGIVENGGFVDLSSKTNAVFIPNSVSGLVLSMTSASLHSGTSAIDTTLKYGGRVYIFSSGTLNGASVLDKGQLAVSSGGKMTGQLTFADKAVVSVYDGAILDFDISGVTPEAGARVNNLSLIHGTPVYTLTVSGSQKNGVYTLAGGTIEFNGSITVQNTSGKSLGTLALGETNGIGSSEYTLELVGTDLVLTVGERELPPQQLTGTEDSLSWSLPTDAARYVVEYSTDDFVHGIRLAVPSASLDSFCLPAGDFQWRVRPELDEEWIAGDPITVEEKEHGPQLVKSDEDGISDVFFANAVGIWESGYVAQHVGSIGDWAGTNEYTKVCGKNKLADIIEGSTDANILLMTDDENGDTLFLDDIYTASQGNIAEKQSRIAQIDEIRAGAGDDIVDMTSQRFEYIGNEVTIRGGDGNDTIWANKDGSFLFGDAGNDRIVGASGNDVIAGGTGNDSMHGGGGDDVFTFCDNWGTDTVEQLADGSVTLWFASGMEENWNAGTLTYSDGDNSVRVSGISADKIMLIFGDDKSDRFATLTGMGAFIDASSERIFEESGKGILANL